MNLLQTLRSRKYLQRILLGFMLVVMLLIAASALLYFNAQSKVSSMEHDADRKLLTQIKYNIENMNQIVKDLAVSTFNDEDFIALKSGDDFEQSILKLDKLTRLVSQSPYLHSIVFYNAVQGRFFSTVNHTMSTDVMNQSFREYMKSHDPLPKLQLTPMELGGGDGVDVFSLFVYDGPTLNAVNGNLLIVNIKPTWMLDNVKALNALAERQNDVIFVTDNQGRVLISNDLMKPDQMDIKNELIPQIAASGKELDYFTYSHEGKKYRVTYLTRGLNDWQIISLQDYDAVLTNVRQIRWTAAIVTASVVLLTILISIYFSIKLYRPIGHLMTLVRRNEGRGGDMHRDELSLIASSYSQMTDKLKELQQDQAAQQNIAKVYRLRNLIAGSTGVPEQDLAHDRAQYGLDIPATGGMIVALARIDNLQEVQARTPEATMSLLYFAICNIGQELIRDSYSCEAVDMKNGHVVFIIGHAGGISHEELRTILRQLQDTVRHYYHITVTMSVSPVFSSYRDITAMYGQALRYADYRMILGKEALIEPSLVQPNEECSQFHIPPELDRQLIEGLKSGDWERINGGMDKWLELVRTFSFENMFSAMLHMFVTLGNAINEMNQNNLQAASVNLQEINRRILEKETLEEVKEVFLDLVRQALDKRTSGREEKARLVAETIREIVARQYADPDLNVQKIADMLRMSHVYLGQVFKEQEGITVVDCINETRLAQARLYLEQQQMTVAEIMEKVGFSNESYFYRLFKRRYGTTPKEYRLKAAINRNA